jgi:transposase
MSSISAVASSSQYFAGLDAHLAYVTVGIVDRGGQALLVRQVSTKTPEQLRALLEAHQPVEAVVETCPFWPWIYDLLTAGGIRVHVAHAKELRAIATSHRKTDERDALLLARMLAAGLIPAIHPKSVAQREMATLLRHRELLVRQRTMHVNRIHAQLQRQRLHLGREQLLRKRTAIWLKTDAWPVLTPEQRRFVAAHWRFIQLVTRMIKPLDRAIAQHAQRSPAAAVLQTVPGIGPVRSLVLATELMPITRFPRPEHVVSYAGLAPSERRSAARVVRGSIPRDANHAVRNAFVSAIVSHVRAAPDSALSAYYARLKPRVGWPVARVAAARRLARIPITC